jgi:hypothetical protein
MRSFRNSINFQPQCDGYDTTLQMNVVISTALVLLEEQMTRKIINIMMGTMLLAISLAPAFARPVRLEYRFRTGHTDKYRVVVKTEQSIPSDTPGAASMPVSTDIVNIMMVQKVIKTNKDGSAAVSLTIKGIGSDIKRIPPLDRNVVISNLGEYLGKKGSLPGTSEGTAIVLPKKRVSVGDTWSTIVALPGNNGSLKATATYKGIIPSSTGKKVHKIVQSYSGVVDMSKVLAEGKTPTPGSTAKAQIEGSGTYLLDRKDCKLIKVTGSLTSTTTIIIPKTKKVPASITRLKSQMDTTVTRM